MNLKIKKIWDFLWHSNSFLSWITVFILALVTVKFIIFPLAGFLLSTGYPVVAIVSGSMEHDGNFDSWWASKGAWYEEREISQEEFLSYPFHNGFNKGDVMVVYGTPFEKLEVGDVIIFWGGSNQPIIHRIVAVDGDTVQTKGDNNSDSFAVLQETEITKDRYLGTAKIRIPYAGWLKIFVAELFS